MRETRTPGGSSASGGADQQPEPQGDAQTGRSTRTASAARQLASARDRTLATLRGAKPLREWLPGAHADPAARMFAGIRLRMTLLYTAILALILGVAGTLLYIGMQ